MRRLAFSTLASVSKLKRASTSVETRPGTMPASSAPTATVKASAMIGTGLPWCARIVSSPMSRKWSEPTAFRTIEGLVVQSCGLRRRTASMSPVSATTTVMSRS